MAPQSLALGKSDTPVLARARELFAGIVRGEGHAGSTAAELADRIEQQLSLAIPGPCTLTEGSIAIRYGVGRRVARQTSRILQQRGIMEPRRGGNGLGGLWAVVPELNQIVSAVHAEIDPCDRKAATDEAAFWLRPALETHVNAPTELFDHLLGGGPDAGADTHAHARARDVRSTQANRVATCLVEEIGAASCDDVYLGSLAAVSLRYNVSLEVVVEAVRILEDHQQVVLKRGRRGGIYLANPRYGKALHMTNAFLAGRQTSPADCRTLLDAANYAMIELACQRHDDQGVLRVRQAFSAMEQARDSTALGKAWYSFIREIADLAGNPILHFTARALAGSILMRRVRSSELPDPAARELFDASRLILDNILNHSDAGNKEAHLRCQFALENYW